MKRADLLREVANLVEAGVPLAKGLDSLKVHLPKPLQAEASQWQSVLEQGRPLSAAWVESGLTYTPGAVALIEAGEASGQLAESLHVLARESEIRERRLSRMATALIYPVLLVHAAALIPCLATWAQQGLPAALLQAVIFLLPIYGILALIIWVGKVRQHSGPTARMIDRLLGRIPVFGKALTRLALARWGRILASLMESGMRLEHAVEQAAGACGNAAVGAELQARASLILSGHSISEILQDTGLADGTVLATLQTGETSGTQPRALRDMAERLEFQSQQNLDRLAILVPIGCYLVGVVIALLQMFRILGPLFQTYQDVLSQ